MSTPVIIIGAGIAGLSTALAAAPHPVLLLSRSDADGLGSASALAQGGIAAALGDGDSTEAHVADTLAAGAQHNDPARVQWLCRQALPSIAWLQRQGVVFDHDRNARLQLGREGGHSASRIVHAGGDATGAMVMRALAAQARVAGHVRWMDGVAVQALRLRGGRACGVRIRDADGREQVLDATTVVLATGGMGALYARTSNPIGAQGAGLALALAAGARMRDLEFVQFHPTALDLPGRVSLPLITEALRGAGARLVDGQGHSLMDGVHPLGDLAPRDVVARRVWQAQQAGMGVLLDATRIDGDWAQRFPTVLAVCLEHGVDPRGQAIAVMPAAHFHMGGIAVDVDGASSVPGLHAVGEVACNGVHGANRLASNSLLEGVACGRHLGHLLARAPGELAAGPDDWRDLGADLPADLLAHQRELLWHAAGPLRSQAGLQGALRSCLGWRGQGWQARVAVAILVAALRRQGSLGAHWRVETRGAPVRPSPRALASC